MSSFNDAFKSSIHLNFDKGEKIMSYSHSILNYTTNGYIIITYRIVKTWCASQRIKHGSRGVIIIYAS